MGGVTEGHEMPDIGTDAQRVEAEGALERATAAFREAKWNVTNGFDLDSAVIVERASWDRLREALMGTDR